MTTSTVDAVARLQDPLTARAPLALGVFRILVGLMYAMHGTVKLFAFPNGPMVTFGAWPGWWAAVLEVVFGLLIAVGFATRVSAFISSGVMAVAYFWKHFPDGFWPIANDGETAALYSFIFALLVFTGPGALALRRQR
ncbi:DoxX family protein [Mycolicibacterium neoaurum]|uniref:DoxX family protein n=1 Tax=Mycolicibacterium neoaurum TaxID=1795 RepID=A0AAV2WM96_MYCNE|nr:DoxX family protein [Mycolicibacterium neoaurum]CDQ45365.1 DoxX family protein [Mycolicibacterium neoaurum]